MAGDGHFASQNVLRGIPKGATPATSPPWLDFLFPYIKG